MINPALKASLQPAWYWQPELFEREREQVFTHNWVFVGLAEDLAKHNAYLSTTVAGLPVVVRRTKEKLTAFRNVCSHRHSIIHPAGCGNAMFRCPYHGWTYDADGVPVGVPDNAKSFGLDKDAKRELALERFSVDQCGVFVFVRLSPQGISLRDYLGPLAARLEEVSQYIPAVYGRFTQPWACNWKMGVEITMEGYHAPLVHPESFSKHVGLTEMGDEGVEEAVPLSFGGPYDGTRETADATYFGPHSTSLGPISPDSVHHLKTIAARLKMNLSPTMSGYEHFLIYPNLLIGINEGVNVCVQRYEPLAADQTEAGFWLLTGTPDAKMRDGIIWQTATKGWHKWTEDNSTEDKIACEATQKGVRYAQVPALLGGMEQRLAHFQAALLKDVEGKRIAA